MLFLAPWFWAFAAVAVPVYWLLPRPVRLAWLLLASLVFQWHFAGPAGVAPVLVLAALTWAAALVMRQLGRWSAAGLVIALLCAALAYFKYSAFLLASAATAGAALGLAAPDWWAAWSGPAVPLGISFFTFEFVHYLYEVRVHGRAPIRSPLQFGVFALFFPTLAAGPIKRFPDFVPQLETLARPDWATLWSGVGRIIRGLFKKVCIADLLVEAIVPLQATPRYTAPLVIVLAVLQGWRIYYDFSGYTDMAIGLSRLLNLRVPENFDRPYGSTSLREFWRRWHMSLSTWIRDYVYIPLGGNRARRSFNLLAAMLLCGLWHGAAWNFAAWGLFHGFGLAVESGLRRAAPGLFGDTLPQRVLGWTICYGFVTFGWLIFFYPLETVGRMTRALLVWS